MIKEIKYFTTTFTATVLNHEEEEHAVICHDLLRGKDIDTYIKEIEESCSKNSKPQTLLICKQIPHNSKPDSWSHESWVHSLKTNNWAVKLA